MTVGQPGPMIRPTGLGIGPTQTGWLVMSFSLAAGKPPIITVLEPLEIIPGPPGTQPGSMHGRVMSVTRAAGAPPISTLGCPLIMVKGNGGCGAGVGTGAGGWIGAWQWGPLCKTLSPIRAAGIPMIYLIAIGKGIQISAT